MSDQPTTDIRAIAEAIMRSHEDLCVGPSICQECQSLADTIAAAIQRERARADRWQSVADAYEAERSQALEIIATLGIPDTEDQGGHPVPGATRDTVYALRWLAQERQRERVRAERAERERDEARGLLVPADDFMRRMDIEMGQRQRDAMSEASTPRPTTSRLDV